MYRSYIEEAERLCGRIAFVDSGRIVRIDTVEELVQPLQSKHIVQIACANGVADLQARMESVFPELSVEAAAHGFVRVASDQPVRVGPLVRFLEEQGVEVSEARRLRPSLEDVFVRITGIEADAMHKEKEKAGGGA